MHIKPITKLEVALFSQDLKKALSANKTNLYADSFLIGLASLVYLGGKAIGGGIGEFGIIGGKFLMAGAVAYSSISTGQVYDRIKKKREEEERENSEQSVEVVNIVGAEPEGFDLAEYRVIN